MKRNCVICINCDDEFYLIYKYMGQLVSLILEYNYRICKYLKISMMFKYLKSFQHNIKKKIQKYP